MHYFRIVETDCVTSLGWELHAVGGVHELLKIIIWVNIYSVILSLECHVLESIDVVFIVLEPDFCNIVKIY